MGQAHLDIGGALWPQRWIIFCQDLQAQTRSDEHSDPQMSIRQLKEQFERHAVEGYLSEHHSTEGS